MKIYSLKREQSVNKPIDEVFDFFSKPDNLAGITPSSLGFEIMTPRPLSMKEGTLIDYTIRLLGFRVHWRTVISLYDPPHRFIDEQLKGPYTFWHHTHTFASKGGGTIITDEVRYVIPLGLLGRLVHRLFVRRKLKRIFDFRAQVIRDIFSDT